MSGIAPDWLVRLLGIDPAGDGHGVALQLEHYWNWSAWITLMFVAIVAVCVWLAYRRESASAKLSLRVTLATIRFGLIGLVLLMIAGWVVERRLTHLPYLAVLLDVSESMSTVDPPPEDESSSLADRFSAVRLTDNKGAALPATRLNRSKLMLLESDARLLSELSQRYDVKLYFVGEGADDRSANKEGLVSEVSSARATDKSTRLGDCVEQVLADLRGSPAAALVLLSDGVTTDGKSLSDVAPIARRQGVRVYPVAAGADRPLRDVRLTDLQVENVVFVDEVVTFQARLWSSAAYAGKKIRITLRRQGDREPLVETAATAPPEGQFRTVRVLYRPKEVGTFRFVVEAQRQAGESDTGNNTVSDVVTVRDLKIKVLLVQGYPSWEFRYLKQMLLRQKTIELTTLQQDADLDFVLQEKETAIRDFPDSLDQLAEYDVLLWGDVDPSLLGSTAMSNIYDYVDKRGRGLLMFAGPRFNPLAYRDTPLESLAPIDLSAARNVAPDEFPPDGFRVVPTDLGLASSMFQIGESAEETARLWRRLPPLHWAVEAPKQSDAVRVLAEHPTRTTADGEKLPLIMMQLKGAGKVIYHAVDGTWRWRKRFTELYFARYWVQAIRSLARSKLIGQSADVEVTTDRGDYRRGQPVTLRVRFVDERQAPAADDGVRVTLFRNDEPDQTHTLSRKLAARGVFQTVVNGLAAGAYRAQLEAPAVPGRPPTHQFTVHPPPGESDDRQVDLDELRAVAKRTGGRLFRLSQADELLEELPPGEHVPVRRLPAIALWNRWPVPTVFFALLLAEWIVRKRKGML